nr:meiotic recombination protein DMC1 homolog isoform X2 [Tanacetum cinerariifolium]
MSSKLAYQEDPKEAHPITRLIALGLNDESVKKLQSAGISTCNLFVKHPKEAVTVITGLADDKASEILEAAKKLVKTSGDDLLIEQQEHFVFVKGFSKKPPRINLQKCLLSVEQFYAFSCPNAV